MGIFSINPPLQDPKMFFFFFFFFTRNKTNPKRLELQVELDSDRKKSYKSHLHTKEKTRTPLTLLFLISSSNDVNKSAKVGKPLWLSCFNELTNNHKSKKAQIFFAKENAQFTISQLCHFFKLSHHSYRKAWTLG